VFLPSSDYLRSLRRRWRRRTPVPITNMDLWMRIRVQEAADLGGLVAFLQTWEYVAEQVGPNTVEVSRPSSVRHDHIRVELDLFLEAWHAAHPEARAEFVE
jgi:hypothetical protein